MKTKIRLPACDKWHKTTASELVYYSYRPTSYKTTATRSMRYRCKVCESLRKYHRQPRPKLPPKRSPDYGVIHLLWSPPHNDMGNWPDDWSCP